MRFAIVVTICAVLPACSSNMTRFDYPVLGMNEDAGKDSAVVRQKRSYTDYSDAGERQYNRQDYQRDYAENKRDDIYDTASTDKKRDRYQSRYTYDERAEYDRRQVEREKLPDLQERSDRREYGREETKYSNQNAEKQYSDNRYQQTRRVMRDAQDRHIVGEGDTLYNISRRYGVATDKIREANGLQGNDIKLGQHLYIPGLSKGQSKKIVASKKTGGQKYRVSAGDTLYGIARRHGVTPQELADANGITDNNVKLGQDLMIPGDGVSQTPVQVASIERKVRLQKSTIERSKKPVSRRVSKSANDKKIKLDKKIVRSPVSGKNRFMWPVDGKILSKFGRQKSGTVNDGVNLAVPTGTNVKAAEGGVVAYAGNELKGYGNLILVRHKDNWVTAYAHNSKLLVKRGDKVRRGQIIAKSGKSGSVYQPQLHFELRKGSKPVNPMKHLAMR